MDVINEYNENLVELCDTCIANSFVCPYKPLPAIGSNCSHYISKNQAKQNCEWRTISVNGYLNNNTKRKYFLTNPHNDKKFQKDSFDYKFCPYCGAKLLIV